MRKFISTLIAFAMIMTMSVSAFAIVNNTESKQIGEFQISEIVDSYNRVTRIYERDDNSISSQKKAKAEGDDYRRTKELLLALGMEQDFIDKLTTQDLQSYAASPQLVGTVSYAKLNSKGQSTYLSESEAIQGATLVNEKTGSMIQPMAQGTEEDSYMRVFYLVSYMGNANYKFSTDARWLTMPYFRGKDSIGSCAQNATVTNSTRSGWYECEIYNLFDTKIGNLYANISSGSFKNAINGSWYGSAAILTLPDDFSTRPVKVHKNYKAHYEYQGHVNSPNSVSWFSTTGSYDHATVNISFTPSVSIALGGPSGAIGLDIKGVTETRSVELEIKYTP